LTRQKNGGKIGGDGQQQEMGRGVRMARIMAAAKGQRKFAGERKDEGRWPTGVRTREDGRRA